MNISTLTSMRYLYYTLLCTLSLGAFSSLPAQTLEYRQGELIVQLDPAVNGKDWALQQPELNAYRQLSYPLNIWLVSFDHTDIHGDHLRRKILAQKPVLTAQFNHLVTHRSTTTPNDPLFLNQWQHQNTGQIGGLENADHNTCNAWDVTTGGLTVNGDTIVVCVIDNGIDEDHEDLVPNLWVNRDEIPDNGLDDDGNNFVDDYLGWNTANNNNNINGGSHGTSVTGIVGARGNNELGVTGINWTVKLMVVRNNFLASESEVLEAYSYALDARLDYDASNGAEGAYVVATNASWGIDNGQPADSPIWCSLYESLGQAGILSAGATTNTNTDVDADGDLPTTCPSEFLIGVTNVDTNDAKVIAAGFGANAIDLGAHGESVYTTINNNNYGSFGGTSAATPAVTGAIGLLYSVPSATFGELLSADPTAAARLVRTAILDGARPIPSLTDITVTGAVLDVGAAMDILMSLASTCLPPTSISLATNGATALEVDWNAISSVTSVDLRYRLSGTIDWTEVENVSPPFSIADLNVCSIYEVQLISNCSEERTFSDILSIETDGCCRPPMDIDVFLVNQNLAVFSFEPVLAATGGYTYRYRAVGETDWQEGSVANAQNVQITNLDNCTLYELELRSECTGGPSDFGSSSFTTTGCGACLDEEYCQPAPPDNDEEWIALVDLGGGLLRNESAAAADGFISYDDQFGLVVARGASYPISLLPGYSGNIFSEEFKIWVDWDQNGLFTTGEVAAEVTSSGGQPATATITVPEDAVLENTRMRIVMQFQNVTGVCSGVTRNGEVEDYCLTVIESPGCVSPSELVTFYDDDAENVTLSWPASLAPGGEYLLRYRQRGSTDWIEIMTSDLQLVLADFALCDLYDAEVASICDGQVGPFVSATFNSCSSNQNHQISADHWRAWPNPAADFMRIQWLSGEPPVLITIFDALGRLRLTQVPGTGLNSRIDVSSLPAGAYYLRMEMADGRFGLQPLIKQ